MDVSSGLVFDDLEHYLAIKGVIDRMFCHFKFVQLSAIHAQRSAKEKRYLNALYRTRMAA